MRQLSHKSCRSLAEFQIAAENGHLEVCTQNCFGIKQISSDLELGLASGHLYRKPLRNPEISKTQKHIFKMSQVFHF